MDLVVGASGHLGRRVVRRLLKSGSRVRALSRTPGHLRELQAEGAEVVQGDLLNPEGLRGALDGVRAVIVAAHGLVPPSRTNHPRAVDGKGVRRLIDLSADAGVERVVHMSVAGADREDTAFAREKRATELHLQASGVRWTILRPTLFVENHVLLLMGEPLRAGRRVEFLGRGETPVNWISADDVADEVLRSLEDARGGGAVRTLGGPDRMTRLQALAVLEEVLGTAAKRRHLPLPLVRFLRGLTRPVHPGMSYLLDLMVAEETGRSSFPDASLDWRGSTTVREVVEGWAEGAK